MFRELLVAFDGSSHAQRAFAEARDLAQATAGRLTVMTVVPEPSTWALSSGYGAGGQYRGAHGTDRARVRDHA